MDRYNHLKIEPKWQKFWEKKKLYEAKDNSDKPKYFCLVEFPYPSGAGLHVGHPRSYTAMDIVSRKRRAEGYNVLYPIGWDAFGLPTENYAIKNKIHPREATQQNIATFKRQLKALGFSFDWSREVDTTDPDYYKWTQWIFLQLFKSGLAYKTRMPINWCLSCKIGLANEEVVDGKCERCGGEVEKRDIEQWMLEITKYADRLLKDLDTVDFLDKIKTQQTNWIGRSEGINIRYEVEGTEKEIEVFTTRPDTNFGATFVAIAPDGLFVRENINSFPEKKKVSAYINNALKKTDIDRVAEGRKKTGVFTGLYAINPLTDRKMPIWVADFVLGTVGTGCVVGVPGHDLRDFEFATEFDLDIVRVVVGSDGDSSKITDPEQVQEEEGTMVNSDFLDGMDIHKATKEIMDHMEKTGQGKRTVTYKLRDWVFSRQRYWGEPIPLVFCEKCDWVTVSDKDLPVELPEIEKYEPTETGESPLANVKDWVNTTCPECGGPAKRETDVMPNWAGSSWYFLRYTDPKNSKSLADNKKLDYWMPADWYNGGMEHTTLHLLYSRFWNKFLHDQGHVPTSEPYQKRTSHGMVLAEDGRKMSKSFGNVINPDEMVEQYGADTLRVYLMFMGPFSEAIPWSTKGVVGVRRFLEKVWNLQDKVSKKESEDVTRELHKTIKKVSEDIEEMKYNTAVAQMMILVNKMQAAESVSKKTFETFLIIFAPFAPHVAEELWQALGHKKSITLEAWPKFDAKLAKDETIELPVQINGKLRATINVPADISEDEAKELALAEENVQKHLSGQKVKKAVYVPGRMINFVI